jgi:hypothetical protein
MPKNSGRISISFSKMVKKIFDDVDTAQSDPGDVNRSLYNAFEQHTENLGLSRKDSNRLLKAVEKKAWG